MSPMRVLDYVHCGFQESYRPTVGKPIEDTLSVAPRKHHTGAFEQLQVAADDRLILVEVGG